MAAKRALVVDDSKSARVVLSRMLEKYGIEVDTAESAERGLEYLQTHRPDVIFMDHMMPGMNGLEAVQRIKVDPDLASIPVMMYTSQEGELYAGQAKALGVVGVLPKTIKPIDVTKVLYQLNLLPDRRDARPSALQPIVSADGAASPEDAAPAAPVAAGGTGEGLTEARARGLVEAMLKEQSIELRRFFVATLETHAHRLTSELRSREPEPEVEAPSPLPPPPQPLPWAWIVATLAAIAAVCVLGLLYQQSLDTAREVEAARSRLEIETAELRATLEEVRAAAARRGQAPAAAAAPPPRDPPRPTVMRVPYGEAWLGGNRLETLRNVVSQLERSGFRGTVRVEAFAADFCLVGAEDSYEPAPEATPVAKCATVGNPAAEFAGADRASLAFANLSSTVASRTAGRIQLSFGRGPAGRDAMAYPGAQANAGAWNQAAEANNRVEITVLPR